MGFSGGSVSFGGACQGAQPQGQVDRVMPPFEHMFCGAAAVSIRDVTYVLAQLARAFDAEFKWFGC